MSTTKSFAGQSFNLPNNREPKSSNWGTHTSNFLIAVADNALSKTGGTFTLSAEMSFGATYGLLLPYLKSASANISSTGVIRFANNEGMGWRNAANNADLLLKVNASNVLEYNGNPITALALGAANTVLKMNSGGTATEYGKITTNNIDASAGIVDTQLATISTAGKVSNSATTATDANTANAIVARDASGNFTAGTITAALNGNASTVTTNANLTGVVTSVGNATSIADGALALAKLATTTAGYIPVGAATTGIPTYVAMSGDATLASTGAITLATVPVAKGGTGQTTAALAFDALSPMTTNGDLITRAAGTGARIAAGTDGQVLGMVSGAPAWTDGGGGSGEKNYITNHSAKSAITGWTNVGDLDVARTTTAGDLPREYTTASGIKITADSNTQSTADYVYYDFTLDDVDLSKKLKIQWSQKTTGTYTAGDLAVVITTQADRTTALHTPITTAIPAVDGVFTTYFDASTTATLSLVIRATTDMTTDGGIVISDVVVGPGVGVQGAVVGEWTSYTPTFGAGFGTVAGVAFQYRRVGSSMEILGSFTVGTVAGTAPTFTLPTGTTVNTSVVTASKTKLGEFNHLTASSYVTNSAASAAGQKLGVLFYSSTGGTGALYFTTQTTGGNLFREDSGTDVTATGEIISVMASVPIAEWAGSGTINLAQNDVEYASNSGSWDSADSLSFAYGPSGQLMTGALSASRVKRVRFQTPIQVGDKIEVELSTDRVVWHSALGSRIGASATPVVASIDSAGNVGAGVFWYSVSGSTTDIDVQFVRFPNAANDDAPTGTWPSDAYWRVRKISGGQAVGFGTVSENSSGLMPYSHANLDNASATRLGLKQYLHGTTYNGGAAPTVSYVSGGGSISSVNRGCFVPYQMQDGTWRLKFNISLTVSSTSRSSLKIAVNGVTSHASVDQAFAGAVYTAAAMVNAANTTNNTGNFEISHGTGTATVYSYAGDIELASKPTWAY